jgi:hypothetical protein
MDIGNVWIPKEIMIYYKNYGITMKHHGTFGNNAGD